ncbi:MAG: hypothetical protein R3C61_22335 [Bacteroidia bacterium]
MRICLLLFIPFFLCKDSCGQISGYFGEIGGSYVQNSEFGLQKELAFRNSVGLLLKRNWAVGLKIQHIFYSNLATSPEYMRIWGPFGRWGLLNGPLKLYFEAGINWGNYSVSAFLGDVKKEPGLLYISYGGNLEFRVVKGVFGQLGLIAHEILNRPQPIFGFDSYLVGLAFDLKTER